MAESRWDSRRGIFQRFPPSASSAYNPSPFTSIRYSASHCAKGVAPPGPSRPPGERGHPHFCDGYKKRPDRPPRGKSVNAHPHTPFPTQRPLCHTARHYPGYEDGLPFNANGVVPQSPGLRGSPRYPGCVPEVCNNHNVVVPEEQTCGSPRTGRVAILKTPDGIAHSAGFDHALRTSPDGATAQPLQGCFVIGHLPMVAPWRCNHGLCGRIPLGFPEGDFPMPIPADRGLLGFPDGKHPSAMVSVLTSFVPAGVRYQRAE